MKNTCLHSAPTRASLDVSLFEGLVAVVARGSAGCRNKPHPALSVGKFLAVLLWLCVLWLPGYAAAAGTWQALSNPPALPVGHFLLLSDGTVMGIADPYGAKSTWLRLTPDSHGSYVNGTWSTNASMNYSRLDFGSVVLTNGNVFVVGGEYGTGTTNAEIYNPVSNSWSIVPIPAGIINPSNTIASNGANQAGFIDCETILLSSGKVLITPVAPATNGETVIYDPASNVWSTAMLQRGNSEPEASAVKLADDSILMVDFASTNSERYIPSLNRWVTDANLPVKLYDSVGEEGPGLLLPNGKAIFFGATSNTAIYTPSPLGGTNAGSWVAGTNFPNAQGMPDSPAAMMVNGKILCAVGPVGFSTSTNEWAAPVTFYEYDYLSNKFTQVSAPGDGSTTNDISFQTLMVDLPDGSVLFGQRTRDFYVYKPDGVPLAAGKPVISSISVNTDGSLHLTGKLFNGLSQGASYGDDEQMDSNFPLVRFTDSAGNVRYGRTYNWSTAGVFKTNQVVTTECALPPGASLSDAIQVIANGNASDAAALVTSTADNGPGSLRQAILSSISGSSITFAPSLSGQTITLTSGVLTVSTNLTIDASALPRGITIDGNKNGAVFYMAPGTTNVLTALTITNGANPGNSGGGIYNLGVLTLNRCTVAGNSAFWGGGIWTGSFVVGLQPLILNECTIAGNSASDSGGGIGIYNGALTVNQCTVVSNTAGGATWGGGGGLGNYAGAMTVANSIVAGNAPSSANVTGSFTSSGANLTNNNPQLAPLGYYGGSTPTMPPLPGSPAIDAGGPTTFTTDQRGSARTAGAAPDIGSVESGGLWVQNTADSGAGSLRAVLAANTSVTNSKTVLFLSSLAGATITLSSQILVTDPYGVTIDASGLPGGVQISGNAASRVLYVTNGAVATLNSLTLAHGLAPAGSLATGGGGGGIFCSGQLVLLNCSVVSNAVAAAAGVQSFGGGILCNAGDVRCTNCTIAANQVTAAGGAGNFAGAFYNFHGTMIFDYCTVAGNLADSYNGGAAFLGSTLLASTVLANGNTDLYNAGGAASLGNNFISDGSLTNGSISFATNGVNGDQVGAAGSPLNAVLASLGNYGGPTPTMPPLSGSRLIDAGGATTLATDERGFPRLVGAAPDIGAVESGTPVSGFSPVVTDNSDVVIPFGAGGVSLRAALSFATNNSLITFAPGLSGQTITLSNGHLMLSQNLTIDASALTNGLTISGGNASRIFYVNNGQSLSLRGLTLTDGTGTSALTGGNGPNAIDEGYGGAIVNFGNLWLTRCTLSGNSAFNEGGAIENEAADSLTLTNCTLSGNSASFGGAIGNFGGTVGLTYCTLSGNSDTFSGGFGGGILSYNFGPLTLIGCIIAGNTDASGTAPDLYMLSGTLTANNCLIGNGTNSTLVNGANGNQVGSNGSPINALLAPLGSYGGSAPTMPPLPGSPAIDAGGSTTLATDQRGLPRPAGPFADVGAVELQAPSLVVTTTADSGAGSLRQLISQVDVSSTITFTSTLSGATLTLTNGPMVLNKNLTIDASALPGGITLNGNHAGRVLETSAGALAVVLNALTITNGYDTNTTSVRGGGSGIYNNSGSGASLTVNNCTFAGNATTYFGGGIRNPPGSTLTVNQCTFVGNSATDGGGGIVSAGTAAINQSTLSQNSSSGQGGGLYHSGGTTTLSNSIVAGNNAPSGTNISGTVISTGVNLTNGNPQLGTLANYGGPTPTMPPLPGSRAIDGCANGTGFTTDQRGFQRVVGPFADIGAVEYETSPLVTTSLDGGVGSLRYVITYTTNGSAITFAPGLSGQTITLTNGQLALNQNVTVDASALASGITLNGNHASRIFQVGGAVTAVLNSLAITNGVDTGPNAGGGGILNYGTLTVNNCTLAANAANQPGWGGGGILNFFGTVTLNQSTLSGNSANTLGGAIFSITGTLTLTDCTLSGNSASDAGAIGNQASTVTVAYSTLSGNSSGSGGGGAIDNFSTGSLTLAGCIIAGNTDSSGTAPDLWMEDGPLSANNCLIGNGLSSTLVNGVNGNQVGANGSPINPSLAPLGNYGGSTPTMPPLPGSPAINAGGATTLTNDQRGFPRVVGPAADIGAVELQTPSLVVTTTSDSGAGSLRQVVGQVDVSSTITFAANFSGQTIGLTGGEIAVNKNLIIDGSTLPAGVQISGSNVSRIFNVGDSGHLTLNSLTLRDANGGGGDGGAILNTGNTTLNDCTFTANATGSGGAIFNNQPGYMALNNCTLTGNSSAPAGGGGAIRNNSLMVMNNCTLFGNSSPFFGGALWNDTTGTLDVTNSILAGPSSPNIYQLGVVNSSFNLVDTANVNLAPLGNYGGPTQTMPPLPGSPAIDAGSDTVTSFLATDQRGSGYPRLLGAHVDIGAVEGVYNTTGPGRLFGETRLGNGSFMFSFSNYTDTSYSVFASTNIAAPLNTWSNLGAAVESPIGSGRFQFTDAQAANNPQRFYRVRSP